MKQYKNIFRGSLAFFTAICIVGVATARADVLDDLRSLPGVTATETTTSVDIQAGMQRFSITIEQPLDHFAAESETFTQRLVLFHRGYDEPMVLQTSGYQIFREALTGIARTFGTNQVQVEHRFFAESVPTNLDWSKLTVRQSAADFHKIVSTLRALYGGNWVNTGSSKGGMTSVYFRRFYPDDLQGTIANVAPHSNSMDDTRYIDFLDAVGGNEFIDCRRELEDFQLTALDRRAEILPTISGNFTRLGGKEVALEHAVLEVPFSFWQYGNPDDQNFGCGAIPARDASAAELTRFLREINDPGSFTDDRLNRFIPYFYQAAHELGTPATKLEHIQSHLQYPYTMEQYLPDNRLPPFIAETMTDVGAWVSNEMQNVMLIYGEFDPWSAATFPAFAEGKDNFFYMVPRANHGARYELLPPFMKDEATITLSRWLGKGPVVSPLLPSGRSSALGASERDPSLETLELEAKRRLGIR